MELAVREAMVNAVVHGNAANPDKHVHVTCECDPNGDVSIAICDEGCGFDYDTIPDPTAPENRLSTHGRGIYLMKTMMDEVWFERGGSVVLMRKKSKDG
jgi:serine/threonine-protein kinase RsbW